MSFNPLDLEHKDLKYLVFDRDLYGIYKRIHELEAIVKTLEKRFERRETTLVSKSVFEYMKRSDAIKKTPQLSYSFLFGDTRFCVVRESRSYHVEIHGWQVPEFYAQYQVLNEKETARQRLINSNRYGHFNTPAKACEFMAQLIVRFLTDTYGLC